MSIYIGSNKVIKIYQGTAEISKLYLNGSSYNISEPAIQNYTIHGSPTITSNVVSDLSADDYLSIDTAPEGTVNSFEMVVDFTTVNVSGTQWILASTDENAGPQLFISNYGLWARMYDAARGTTFTINTSLNNNTNYCYKITWDNSSKFFRLFVKNGDNWDAVGYANNIASTTWTANMNIGKSGKFSINLNNCYIKINGQTWWPFTPWS